MKKFKVTGTASVEVTVIVEAEDYQAALDEASQAVPGLTQFADEGLVGTQQEGASVEGGYDIEWIDATEEEE